MTIMTKKTHGIFLLLLVLLVSAYARCEEISAANQTAVPPKQLPHDTPDLSEIIPKTAQLSGQLAKLKNQLENAPDISSTEQAYKKMQIDLNRFFDRFSKLKTSEDYRIVNLIQLRQIIEDESKDIKDNSESLKKEILLFGSSRKQWLADKDQWSQWQSSWQQDETSNQLTSSFTKANDTINTALSLLRPKLEALLVEQEKVGVIQEQIDTLLEELDDLISAKRFGSFPGTSPVMFSSEYVSQFKSDMRNVFSEDLDESLWSAGQYLKRYSWVIFIQLATFSILSIFFYRKRRILNETERWKFLGLRPFSAGLFFVSIIILFINEFQATPLAWKFVNTFFCGVTFIRLISSLTEISWKRRFFYGLAVLAITNRLLYVITLSLPVFRLYVVLVAIAGLLGCWKWSKESKLNNESTFYTGLLRLASVFFGIILITEFWGKDALAFYLFMSMTLTIETIVVFSIFTHMAKGGLEWLFRTSPVRKAVTANNEDIESTIERTGHFVNITLWGLFILPLILLIWGVYDTLNDALIGFMTFGFNLGSQRISVGLVIIAVGIMYGTLLISWIIQKIFMDMLLHKRKIEKGVRLSIERLIHYFILSIGFLIAISTLGFEITKITIMLSALGVGIGFGLQSVVNNFVSGLILLFERPVRVGDTIEIDGQWAEIRNIGLRATRVLTLDQADVIVPNADLISNQVTNWTLSNRRIRATIKVGVAYGSDVPLVLETLAECANISSMVVQKPEPQILFLHFGESSLDFELRVWIKDADYRLIVISQLHQEIDRRFRQANIVIAFPQRDLHISSMDQSVSLPSSHKPE